MIRVLMRLVASVDWQAGHEAHRTPADRAVMRRAAKVDANHNEIAGAFVAMGCSVRSLAAVGGGIPDLLVGFRGRNLLIEVKDGNKPKSARKLTPDQIKFHSEWRGSAFVVEGLPDVHEVIKGLCDANQER